MLLYSLLSLVYQGVRENTKRELRRGNASSSSTEFLGRLQSIAWTPIRENEFPAASGQEGKPQASKFFGLFLVAP